MSPLEPEREPLRLTESRNRVAELLSRLLVDPQYPTANDAARNWNQLEPKLNRRARSQNVSYGLAIAGSIVVMACGAIFLSGGFRLLKPESRVSLASTDAEASPSAAPTALSLQIEESATRQLVDGTVIAVSKGGRARVTQPTANLTQVELERGEVELNVTPRKAGELLEVSAQGFRFRVIGTRFRVAYAPSGLSLSVTEGQVAVLENGQPLEVVTAGGFWTEAIEQPGTATQSATARVSAPTTRSRDEQAPQQKDCLDAARQGNHQAALSCFAEQAKGTGVAAEIAQYEIARIQHEVLGKATLSLETLRRYRERFPNGTLRTEALLEMTKLWVELGKDAQALEASDQLLQSTQLGSRQDELRFLRAKLYQRRGDFARAASEYARAAVSTSAQSDRARLERAGCLEKLGRTKDAQAAYVELSRSRHSHLREEARKRLAKMEPEGRADRELP